MNLFLTPTSNRCRPASDRNRCWCQQYSSDTHAIFGWDATTDKTMVSVAPVAALAQDQVKESFNNDINTNLVEECVEKFSYLNQLSLEKQEDFIRFKSERNL